MMKELCALSGTSSLGGWAGRLNHRILRPSVVDIYCLPLFESKRSRESFQLGSFHENFSSSERNTAKMDGIGLEDIPGGLQF